MNDWFDAKLAALDEAHQTNTLAWATRQQKLDAIAKQASPKWEEIGVVVKSFVDRFNERKPQDKIQFTFERDPMRIRIQTSAFPALFLKAVLIPDIQRLEFGFKSIRDRNPNTGNGPIAPLEHSLRVDLNPTGELYFAHDNTPQTLEQIAEIWLSPLIEHARRNGWAA